MMRKKLKSIVVLWALKPAVLLLVGACMMNPSRYGKVQQYSATDKKSFSFSVDEEYVRDNVNSSKDDDYPLMSKAEVRLLRALLKEKNYCISNEGLSFKINSRQEKIYDVTFAHLIEQNYNAKPIAPRMYFGECR